MLTVSLLDLRKRYHDIDFKIATVIHTSVGVGITQSIQRRPTGYGLDSPGPNPDGARFFSSPQRP
jgi:hypothetical protein